MSANSVGTFCHITEPDSTVRGKPIHRIMSKTSKERRLVSFWRVRIQSIAEARSRLRTISPATLLTIGLEAATAPLNSRKCLPNRTGLYHTELATNAQIAARMTPVVLVLIMVNSSKDADASERPHFHDERAIVQQTSWARIFR